MCDMGMVSAMGNPESGPEVSRKIVCNSVDSVDSVDVMSQ